MFLYLAQYKADFPSKDISEGGKTAMEKDAIGKTVFNSINNTDMETIP